MKQLTIFQRRKKSLLDSVYIAEPCNVGFENMEGDDRVRFCGQCKLNVYNISQMTDKEAEKLIRESDGRTCLRLYRRADGTIITDNCPVGLRAARARLRKVIILFATFVGWQFLIQAVNAQGLVGAPVDGRIRGNQLAYCSATYDNNTKNLQVVTLVSGIISIIISYIRFRKKRHSFSTASCLFVAIATAFLLMLFVHTIGTFVSIIIYQGFQNFLTF